MQYKEASTEFDNPFTWSDGLAHLRERGWAFREVMACCDLLNGHHLECSWSRGFAPWATIPHNMYDGEQLNGIAARWRIPAETWQLRFEQACADESVRQAISAICAEFWRESGDKDGEHPCARALDEGYEQETGSDCRGDGR